VGWKASSNLTTTIIAETVVEFLARTEDRGRSLALCSSDEEDDPLIKRDKQLFLKKLAIATVPPI
jgi:hypothetical protein